MADKTITFTQGVKYDSIPPVTYAVGQKVTLREDLANRWLTRGVATEDADAAKVAAEKQAADDKQSKGKRAAQPVEIPERWRFDLKPDDKIALAKKLGAADNVTVAGADDVILAEVLKRDKAAK